ncbi:hypothetical protein L6E12_05300 [Actinokineospora sp. PR83]|uniref:poly(ethylene terephthalate) hydrolase family protein n=1 Tax=Actinokineospora sp. PR83 TaxID=2884908 RepID=UPI001F340BB7|nr:hypothetical protein [Actinokineospora sp. PR83]MCG8915206.1 hypothetical protein [Actinokineospora sp. PR83]
MSFTMGKSLIALASAAAVGAGALTVTTGAEAAPVAVAPAAVPVHGVDPTDANLRRPVGDLAFSKVTIADSQTTGFGAATIPRARTGRRPRCRPRHLLRENATIGKYATAWLKRFVDEDTRYDKFLCPAPTGGGLTEYTASCPNI